MRRKLGYIVGSAWLLLMLPAMIFGLLWSGSAPFWPPVTIGSQTDFWIWLCSFVAAYGLPGVALVLILASRVRIKD
jgi:hypothetical protein